MATIKGIAHSKLFLGMIIFLVIYQIYPPIIGRLNLTLYFLVAALITLYVLFTNKKILKDTFIRFYILYIVLLAFGLLYGPDKVLGIKMLVLSTTGLFSIFLGRYIKKQFNYEKAIKYIIWAALPLGICNIIFFIFPNLELDFLKSTIAKILIEPNSVSSIFTPGHTNNILDPKKAGTIFLNTNVASIYFGILFWLSVSYGLRKFSMLKLIPMIIYLVAFLACGSRAGLIALVITTLFAVLFLLIKNKKYRKNILILAGILIIILIVLLSTGAMSTITSRLSLKVISNDPRVAIWRFAFSHVHNYFVGLGFGGWEQAVQKFHFPLNIPAQNIFIIVWTWSGIPGLIGLILLLGSTTYLSVRNYMKTNNIYILALFLFFVFVIVQGMFGNYFLNNYTLASLLFVLTGLIME